jgi:hypothetical protein
MKKLLTIVLVLMLTGCATASKVSKVSSGENALGERLTVTLEGAWNQIKAPGMGPAQIWTMEGLPIDQLLIYTGLKDGEAIHATSSSAHSKNFTFRSSMEPDEIVALFEGMLTRDGSSFKLLKLEPSNFGGTTGFHFEYSLTRKIDSVRLSGMGYGAINKGELFAMVYQAPRLTFFTRHKNSIEQIALSARIKSAN